MKKVLSSFYKSSKSKFTFNKLKLTKYNRHYSVKVNENPFELASYLSGKHLINGEFVAPINGKNFDIVNPATREKIGEAAEGDEADVNKAVEVAKKAQHEWAELPVRQRGNLLYKAGELLSKHTEELARICSLETGKAVRTESRVEAGIVGDAFKFYGGLAPEIKGETIPWNPKSLTYTIREPAGVVGAIVPWNVPMMLMALKVSPALVCGNTVVVKSAEEAPFCVLRVAEIVNSVLPPGVFNLLSGYGPECGEPLVKHKDVAKVSFTGSVETGKIVYKNCASKLIPATLELGGKSPMIVAEDANLEAAVDGAIVGMRFTRQGQSCTAASRIFVHESLHDAFVKRLLEKVDKMKIGDPLDEATDMGTIVSTSQFERVNYYIEEGKKENGVQIHQCCTLPTDSKLSNGLFARPTLFTGITNDSKLAREEIFGPVTCIIKWNDFDDVLRQANDTEFGLASSIWTTDLKKALRAVKELESGIVQVNQNQVIQPNLPVGGYKNSGLGKEASLESMIEHFTHSKTVSINFN